MTLKKGENAYIYGLHDSGGEHLMMVGGEAKGWVLVTEAIGSEPHERGGGDYRSITGKGIGLIVRLNQSYGQNGTIPREARYPEFAQRVANFVEDSQGANIWLIGNEMNFEREQPRRQGSSEAELITPRRYAECYKMCRAKIKALPGHEDDLVVVGSMAPWNAQTKYPADPKGAYPANSNGDWIAYMRDILLAIGPENCDAISIHAYSHGYRAEMVHSDAKMDPPFQNRYFNFYTYKDQMNAIPREMRHLPVYLTEANGDREGHGGPTWPFGNNGWIKEAYKEINNWNETGQQQIRCMILFRWMKDPLGWSIDGKPGVQQDFTEAIAQNYQWDPTAQPGSPETPETPEGPGVAAKDGYRAQYLSHNTPTVVPPGQTLTIPLTLQNAGSYTWTRGGSKPFSLGFQWYNAAGQMVRFPSNLDFRTQLPNDVPPGGVVVLSARLRTPNQPGTYHLRWDMIHEFVTWFTTQGDQGLLVSPMTVRQGVTVQPPKTSSLQIQDISATLARSRTSSYPTRSLSAVRRIIMHHSVANVTPQRIAQYQVNTKNLPGITYHFCITPQGVAYQTQPMTVISAQATQAYRNDSIGVCLIGNFTDNPPPQVQLDAAAAALAQIVTKLNLTPNQIVGYNELIRTGSPGNTWPRWKGALLGKVSTLMTSGQTTPGGSEPPTQTPPQTPTDKPINHYLLFWHRGQNNWSEWDLRGAFDYIATFAPTIGFSIEQAKLAKYVTIVGGPAGVPASAERTLRAAGCQVGRVSGNSEADTRRQLERLAAQNRRF
ncbi:MAG: N-acetylmuramoyl-L-alanine amidase [Chloroflexota bacterium]